MKPVLTKSSAANRHALWQSPDRASGRRGGLIVRTGGPAIWSAILVTAAVLFGGLVWLLTYTPQRTPVHLIVAAPYQWPMPPNAWAAEDIGKLRALDGQTITLHGDDAAIFDRQQLVSQLRQTFVDLGHQRAGQTSLIMISMHGVAETADGPAYLVPPSASPIDSSEWLDVDTLLDLIEQNRPAGELLVVLDGQKFLNNWNIGLKANHFVAAVQHAVASRQLHGTTFLASCADGERSLAVPDLQGTIFGHHVAMGLAGVADGIGSSGDRDGWVTLRELTDYLVQSTNRDAEWLGSMPQHPTLFASGTDVVTDERSETRLTRSMSTDQIDDMLRLVRETSRPAPWIASSQLDDLWKRLDGFRERGLYQHEPIAFRDLEHQLLWLESLTEAGQAYRDLCERTFEETSARILAAERRLQALGDQPSFDAVQSVLSGAATRLPRSIDVHSLPMTQYFGGLPEATVAVIKERLQALSTAPESNMVRQAISQFNKVTSTELESARFFRMVDRYGTERLWQRSDLVAKLIDTQQTVRLLATPLHVADRNPDHRTHAWMRAVFADVDTARRAAEDCLFLRDCDDLERSLAETETAIISAQATQRAVDTARRLCDMSMCETAYFAAWLMDPRRRIASTDVEMLRETVLPLMRSTTELSGLLSRPNQSNAAKTDIHHDAEAIRAAAGTKVDDPLARIRRELAGQRERLLLGGQSGQGKVLGDLEAMLQLPVLDWQSRRDLRATRRFLQQQLHERSMLDEFATRLPTDVSSRSVMDWAELAEHPLDMILAVGATETESKKAVSNHNPIQGFVSRLAASGEHAATPASIQRRRILVAEHATRVRAAAPIWFPDSAKHVLERELQVNLQCLLLWHAERTLADFWGPAGTSTPYFDRACEDYLAAVRLLESDSAQKRRDSKGFTELDLLEKQLTASCASAERWIRIVAGPALQLDLDEPAIASIAVMGEPTDKAFLPPVGRATIVVRAGDESIMTTRVQPSDWLRVPVLGTERNVTIGIDDGMAKQSLRVQTVFRGHEYTGPLTLQSVGGYRVDLRPHQKTVAEVTLNARREPLSVAFILDASASMAKGIDGAGGRPARIEIAKSVLQESLVKLADRGDCRVAVRFFGHRIGWSTDRPVRPVPRPDLGPVVTANLRPSQDVEAVLRLTPLNLLTARRVMPELQQVKPWGQSPLYLSLVQSLQEFRDVKDLQRTHVIVITDGANYQFIPPGPPDVSFTTLDDVKGALSEVPVPVHIFGLGIDHSEDRQAIGEFEQLCKQTGGRFHQLRQAGDLKDALSDLLELGGYRVRRLDRNSASPRTATLGNPVRVDCRQSDPVICQIEYQGRRPADVTTDADATIIEPLIVSAGQSPQLYVDAASRSILAYPFDQSVATAVPLVSHDGQLSDRVLRLHRPRQTALGVVTFPISWQRVAFTGRDESPRFRATPQPESVWIEIQPMDRHSKPVGDPYVFYDATFVKDQPVPLLQLPAASWPSNASRASVNVWSRPIGSDTKSTSNAEVVLNGPKPPTPEGAAKQTPGLSVKIPIASLDAGGIDVVPGVRLKLDRSDQADGLKRLRFVIQTKDGGAVVTDYKLDLVAQNGRRPERIVRRFDRSHGVALHTFYVDPTVGGSFTQVRVVNRTRETNGAWMLFRGPVTIPVARSSGFLRTTRLPRP